MTQVSPAYERACSMHSALFEDEENQSRGSIAVGDVRADISEPYKTQRLTIFGEIDGKRVYQNLAKSIRNGHFYLSTVFTEPGGAVQLTRITEQSPPEICEVLEATLFAQAIRKIMDVRPQP